MRRRWREQREGIIPMKCKKVVFISASIVSICVLAIGGIYLHKKREQNSKICKAQELFVAEILPEYEKELATKGLEDIKVRAEFCEKHRWDEWTCEVNMRYESVDVDQYYTNEYESEGCVAFANMLKNMQKIEDKYCKEYEYVIDGKTIIINFAEDYFKDFFVYSDKHTYEADSGNGILSLVIDHELIYYHDSYIPPKAEMKKEETTKKPSYSYGSSKKKKEYPDDAYDVYEYSDPEDFYYDNYDDFFEYEEAEDYYNDAWSEY